MSDTGNREQGTGIREDEFELALTRALRRVDAPVGFAVTVVERTASHPTHDDGTVMNGPPQETVMSGSPRCAKVLVMRRQVWMSSAVAAALVAGVFVAQDVHQRHEREMANRQFALSVQIEERALEHTRQQLEKAGVPLE